MTRGEQIKLLIKSHYDQDEEYFQRLVIQLAAAEARKGHVNIARDIKRIVDDNRLKNQKVTHLNQVNEQIDFSKPRDLRLSQLIVKQSIKERLKRIVHEFKMRDKLNDYGLENRRKILLVGPPGTGKTMTASILAAELNKNLGIIKLEKLITKYMGETSVQLKEVFNTINASNGVYLFDEFDAIASSRNQANDVGEMRRVVNSLLQYIEKDQSDSIIIAATNDLHAIDQAMFRRFDDVIFYENPDIEQIEVLIKNTLRLFDTVIDYKEIATFAEGLSHAEITKACEEAVKTNILYNEAITQDMLIQFIEGRKRIYR